MLSRLLSSLISVVAITCLITLLAHSRCVIASDKLNVSGFVGIGTSHTTKNNFLGEGKSSIPIIEIGLSASYQINNNLNFTGQIGQRRFGESFSDENPRVDFASFNFFSNHLEMGEQSISLGRVKLPLGFYNASRDVPSTRPSILLPQSVYLDIFRNSILSVDGIQLNTTNDLLDGTLFIDATIGRPQIDDNFNQAMFGSGAKGDWQIDLSKSLHVSFNNDIFSLGATYTILKPDYTSKAGDRIIVVKDVFELPVVNGTVEIRTLVLSARVYFDQLEWSNEYLYRDIMVDNFVPGRGKVERPQEGYYTQVRYPLFDNIDVFARWERFYRNAHDKNQRDPRPLPAPLWAEITTSMSVGASYQINRNWQVAAEIHSVNGSAWLPPFFITTPEATESKDWTLSAVQISYRF